MIQAIDHLVITTAQVEPCLAFYEKLGFAVRAAGARYELLAGDFKINVHLSGSELSPHAERVQPGSADLCFVCSGDLSVYRAALEEKGLTAELGMVERSGAKGPMRSFYLRDPDGNLIECCSYE